MTLTWYAKPNGSDTRSIVPLPQRWVRVIDRSLTKVLRMIRDLDIQGSPELSDPTSSHTEKLPESERLTIERERDMNWLNRLQNRREEEGPRVGLGERDGLMKISLGRSLIEDGDDDYNVDHHKDDAGDIDSASGSEKTDEDMQLVIDSGDGDAPLAYRRTSIRDRSSPRPLPFHLNRRPP